MKSHSTLFKKIWVIHSQDILIVCSFLNNKKLYSSVDVIHRDVERVASLSRLPACRPESSGNYWFISFFLSFFFFFFFPLLPKGNLGLCVCEVCGRVWSSCPYTGEMYKCERTWKKTSVYKEKDTVVSRKSQSDEKNTGIPFYSCCRENGISKACLPRDEER
jgi:hypothetical protein